MTIWIKNLTSLEEVVLEIICVYVEVMRDLEFTFPSFNRTMIILTPDTSNIGRKRSKNFHDGRTVEQRS